MVSAGVGQEVIRWACKKNLLDTYFGGLIWLRHSLTLAM